MESKIQIPSNIFKEINTGKHDLYQLEFNIFMKNEDIKFDHKQVEMAIVAAMDTLFGQCGVALDINLIEYNIEKSSGIITAPLNAIQKLWSALTLKNKIEDTECTFLISRINAILL